MINIKTGKFNHLFLMTALLVVIMLLPPLHVFGQTTLRGQGAEQLFLEGRDLMDNRNHEAARERFSSLKSQYPEDHLVPDASYYEAYCALVLYHRDGEKLIKDFLEKYPAHPKSALAYYELGSFYYKGRNYPKAIEYLLRADHTRLNSAKSSEVYFMIGYSYFNLRKLNEAHPFFNRLKNGTGQYATASSYYSGYISFENENYAEAVADFDRAEKNEDYSAEIPYMKASALFKAERYDELLTYTQQKLNSNERFYNAQTLALLRAEALFMREDYEKAVVGYNEYLEQVRGRIDDNIQYRIAYSKYQTGDREGAQELFKNLASRRGDIGIYSSYYLGVLYLDTDNKRYALTAFDKVRSYREESPLKEDASFQYAKLAFDLENSTLAINALEEYTRQYPGGKYQNEVTELLSEAYLSSNDYERAVKHIESLPSRNENINRVYQKANYLLGTVYFNKADYRRAVAQFSKSLEYPLDRDITLNAYYWSGEAYSIGRRFEEAIENYVKVRNDTRSRDKEFYKKSAYGLGYSYYNTEQYEKARVQFTIFLGDPGNSQQKFIADARVRLADCYYIAKNYNAAVQEYNTALRTGYADRDYANLQIGIVSMLLDQPQQARERFDRVLATGSVSRYYDDALFQKAQLLFNQTDYAGAIDLYTRLIEERKSSVFIPFALIRRASAYYNTQKYDNSAGDYIRLINDYVRHPLAKDALLPLQETLSMINRGEEYDQYLSAYRSANPDEQGFENIEFESSKNRYFNQEYAQAIKGLRAFVATYPEDTRTTESVFYIGDSYYRLQKYDSSRIWLEQIDDQTSFWQYPRVVERLADLELRSANYNQAAYYFGISESLADNKRLQNQARTGRMISYFNLAKYDSTIVYARKIMDSGGTDVNAENRASLYLGKSLYAMGRFDEARDEFLNTTNNAKDAYGAEAQYLLGEIMYRNGQNRQSIEVLIDLNEKYSSYLDWVGMGFLLIADNYIAMNDFFQARGTLTSLVENFPEETVKREAQRKLDQLDVIEERRLRQLDSLSTDSIVVDTLKSNNINNEGNN